MNKFIPTHKNLKKHLPILMIPKFLILLMFLPVVASAPTLFLEMIKVD